MYKQEIAMAEVIYTYDEGATDELPEDCEGATYELLAVVGIEEITLFVVEFSVTLELLR